MAGPAIGQIRPFGIIFTGVLPSKSESVFNFWFICMYYYFAHLPQHVLGSNKYYVCTIGINSYTYVYR